MFEVVNGATCIEWCDREFMDMRWASIWEQICLYGRTVLCTDVADRMGYMRILNMVRCLCNHPYPDGAIYIEVAVKNLL